MACYHPPVAMSCRGLAYSLLILGVAVAAGCRQDPASPAALEVVRAAPDEDSGPVLLNQQLTVDFSEAVDPLTVTADSVYVLDGAGHRIGGQVRAGSHSVSFVPEPPLRPDLSDGSFRPDGDYRLVVAGYPRPDALRSRAGTMLARTLVRNFRTISLDVGRHGLPSPLLPVGSGLEPFLLRKPDLRGQIPADAGVLRLQFTTPVLPTTLVPAAVEISLLGRGEGADMIRVAPHSMRLLSLTPPIDEYPGCTLEIDLGREVRLLDGSGARRLAPGDMLVVALARGPHQLTDYSGRPVGTAGVAARFWEVVPGASVVLADWSGGNAPWLGDDPLAPGFEVRPDATVMARLRAEAGDGSFGVFRPRRDTVLRVGQAFDRGDGVVLLSTDGRFPFLAVDVPEDVTVTIEASEHPMLVQSAGSMRIAGSLQLRNRRVPPAVKPGERVRFRTLVESSSLTLVAAGDLQVSGEIRTPAGGPGDAPGSCLTLGAGGRIALDGPVPPHTILAVEQGAAPMGGVAEQSIPVLLELTPGLPDGAVLDVVGASPWRLLPVDRDRADVELQAEGDVQVALQFAPPDPLVADRPDRMFERWSHPVAVVDRMPVVFLPGSHVRVLLVARARGGAAPPGVAFVRLRAR